jgi:hypothetical protein
MVMKWNAIISKQSQNMRVRFLFPQFLFILRRAPVRYAIGMSFKDALAGDIDAALCSQDATLFQNVCSPARLFIISFKRQAAHFKITYHRNHI